MKYVIVSTYEKQGGAAIAALRLLNALLEAGVEAKMLVLYQQSSFSEPIIPFQKSKFNNFKALVFKAIEKLHFLRFQKNKNVRWLFTTAQYGFDLKEHELIQDANIINLHWIHHSFLSTAGIKDLLQLNKPVIWTLHDMWAFTGGCHYSGDCDHYLKNCGNCYQFLKHPSPTDLSNKIWRKKESVYQSNNLCITAPSNWLGNCARTSSLLQSKEIFVIPNPIDTSKFKPTENKISLRTKLSLPTDKVIIAFSAMKISDERKGMGILIEAMKHLQKENPTLFNTLFILAIGKNSDGLELPINILFSGFITDENSIIEYYQSADIFISPSLQDNLSNTVLEAMACGLPAIVFDIGGMSDLVQNNVNGLLVQEIGSHKALATAIIEIQNNKIMFSENSRKLAVEKFSNQVIVTKLLSIPPLISL